jgi:CRISPR-associated protein Cas1
MTEPILPPLKPIPIKDRLSVLFVDRGQLDVLEGAFVLVDKHGVHTHIPVDHTEWGSGDAPNRCLSSATA